jgi:hypothetical protein
MKARAGGFQVECRRPVRPQFLLHQASGGGKGHIRRDGRHCDQVDLFSGYSSVRNGSTRRFGGQIGGEFLRRGYMAFFYSRAAGDPFVGGVYDFSKSWFVSTFAGTYEPTPAMEQVRP